MRVLVTGAGGFVGRALLPVVMPVLKALDARRRVAARMPPPASLAIRAVMNGGDLAQLQRVTTNRVTDGTFNDIGPRSTYNCINSCSQHKGVSRHDWYFWNKSINETSRIRCL